MKKILSLVLCFLILSSVAVTVMAAGVDSEVSYSVALEVSAPKNGRDTYYIGETVTVKVAVSTKDANGDALGTTPTAPVYGFNGTVNYDSLMLSFEGNKTQGEFKNMVCNTDEAKGRLTFTYLCPVKNSELAGVKVSEEFVAAQFEFKVLRDGISEMTLTDLVFTNKDASARPILSLKGKNELVSGTGVNVSDSATLTRAITNAKAELEAAVMNPSSTLVYPAFTVSKESYDALDEAIKNAERTLSKAELSDEFAEAEKLLASALKDFEAAKLYGERFDSSSIDSILDKQNEFVELLAVAHENGSLVAGHDRQLVRYGTSATVQAVPDEGYEVVKVVVNGKEYKGDSIITIASLTSKTQVEFFFAKKPRFVDVTRDKWYFDAVEKIAETGLFEGTSKTEFSPEQSMTRAMLVTVLHRLDGKSAPSSDVTFTDVEKGTWYTDAIAWASENSIVGGYGDGRFGTNDSISRQDMITILYRYLKYKGLTPSKSSSLDRFEDATEVGDWAREALEWATGVGIIQGTGNTTLAPRDASTRAQVATVMLRYTEFISQ